MAFFEIAVLKVKNWSFVLESNSLSSLFKATFLFSILGFHVFIHTMRDQSQNKITDLYQNKKKKHSIQVGFFFLLCGKSRMLYFIPF